MFSLNVLLMKYVINKYDNQFETNPQLQQAINTFNTDTLKIIQQTNPTIYKVSELINDDKLTNT